jgi:hypothetical protein
VIDFDQLDKEFKRRIRIHLQVPIIHNIQREDKSYGMEKRNLSPEIHNSTPYALWTGRRPDEQVFKDAQGDQRKTRED